MDLILEALKRNILNPQIVASAIDALDGMIQNQLVSAVVAEKDAIDLLIKIMKAQDWSEMVVLKCFRVLSNIATLKQNSDMLLKHNIPMLVSDILKS